MDFIKGLPRTSKKHHSIMVMVERLSKVSHFITMKSINLGSEVAQIFIKEIVRLHGVPKKIISYKYANFTYRFWKELFLGFETELAFYIAYHPQTNG